METVTDMLKSWMLLLGGAATRQEGTQNPSSASRQAPELTPSAGSPRRLTKLGAEQCRPLSAQGSGATLQAADDMVTEESCSPACRPPARPAHEPGPCGFGNVPLLAKWWVTWPSQVQCQPT